MPGHLLPQDSLHGEDPHGAGASGPRWGRAAALAAIFCAIASLSVGAERRIQVRGRILDPEGRGVAGQTVKLFKTRRGLTLGSFSSGGQIAEMARAMTDENGYYEVDVPRDRSFDNYYLRYHDPASFDSVRFRIPDDREITLDLKAGEPLRLDVKVEYAPGWDAVSKRLEAVGGEASPQGRILRSLGIPEKEARGVGPDGPRDEWWYYSQGVVYFFRDGEASGYRRFEPVTSQHESTEN